MYSTGNDGSVAHRLSTHKKDKSLTNGTPALVPLSDSAFEAREFRATVQIQPQASVKNFKDTC